MKNILAGLIIFMFSFTAQAGVWEIRQDWNNSLENAYSEWIEKVPVDIFTSPSSKWGGIGTDCADTIYLLRAIFAYENGLPIQFTSLYPKSANITTAQTTWDHLPENERVLAFFKQIIRYTSTATLGADTYPIKISSRFIKPGVIFLNPLLSKEEEQLIGTQGGHAEIIQKIQDNGFMRTIYSTTPVAVRPLLTTRNPYTWPLTRDGGYRRWINPSDRQMPKEKLVGYSEEQFSVAGWKEASKPTRKQIYQWHETFRREIRKRQPSVEERQEVVIESICNLWQGRVTTVQAAWQEVEANGGKCLSERRMDDHSTNKRDARILEAYGQLNDLTAYKKREFKTDGTGRVDDLRKELRACRINTGYFNTDAWELFLRLIDGHIEPNAIYSPDARWGKVPKDGGSKCL